MADILFRKETRREFATDRAKRGVLYGGIREFTDCYRPHAGRPSPKHGLPRKSDPNADPLNPEVSLVERDKRANAGRRRGRAKVGNPIHVEYGVDLVARPDHMRPVQERVAAEDLDVLGKLVADVDAELRDNRDFILRELPDVRAG